MLVTGPGIKEPVRVVTGQRLRASASGADLGLEGAPLPARRGRGGAARAGARARRA